MTPDAALQKVAALRALCLRLPHLTTAAELKRIRRFAALVDDPRAVTAADGDALRAGCREWWRQGHVHALVTFAEKLPPGLPDADRELATYLEAARMALEERRIQTG